MAHLQAGCFYSLEFHLVHDPINYGTENGSGCLRSWKWYTSTHSKPDRNSTKMTLVLAPIEEITQAISKETATLSLVIPFVRVLLKSWEKEDDDRGIRNIKKSDDLKSEVKICWYWRQLTIISGNPDKPQV